MKTSAPHCVLALAALALSAASTAAAAAAAVPLFDGATFNGWQAREGIWRIENGALTAGGLESRFAQNEFIATTRPYANFILRLEVRLLGIDGFVNGGVQLRSTWHPTQLNEMVGYQADIGNGYTGSLYDESRRNRTLVTPDPALIQRLEKLGDWNAYEIRCEGPRIRISLNGTQTVDYTETDPAIPLTGLIALQNHGGATAQIFYRNIVIEELPGPEPAAVAPVSTAPMAGRGGGAPAAGRGSIPRITPDQMGALMPLLAELNALQASTAAPRTELVRASLAEPRDNAAIAARAAALATAEFAAANARAAAVARLQASPRRLAPDQLAAFLAVAAPSPTGRGGRGN